MTAAGLVERAPALFAGVPEDELRVIGESFALYNQAVVCEYDVSLLSPTCCSPILRPGRERSAAWLLDGGIWQVADTVAGPGRAGAGMAEAPASGLARHEAHDAVTDCRQFPESMRTSGRCPGRVWPVDCRGNCRRYPERRASWLPWESPSASEGSSSAPVFSSSAAFFSSSAASCCGCLAPGLGRPERRTALRPSRSRPPRWSALTSPALQYSLSRPRRPRPARPGCLALL